MNFTDQNWISKTVYSFDGVWWSAKYVFAPNSLMFQWEVVEKQKRIEKTYKQRKKLHFGCVDGWYLLY